MNAVKISIGGIISSIFFIYLCIALNSEEYYNELNIHHTLQNINDVSLKPTLILRDRSLNNITQINVKNQVEDKKERLVNEPNFFLLDKKNIADRNLSLSKSILTNIQDRIFTLLQNKKITFKKNSGKLSKDGKEVLDRLFNLLSEQKKFILEIQGHTDAGGKAKFNQRISQIRANSVKKYLLEKGISAKNIEAKGFGESKLLFLDKPYSQKNRRVEIYIKRRENVRAND